MASKVVQICEQKINPIITELGYEVVEVEYAKMSNGMNLTFFIDSPNGITIDDCEKVNDAITDVLDEINPTNNESYTLNVSSPGLDRPIKNYNDFLRNKGKLVEISLYTQVDKKKNYQGLLEDFTDENVCLIIDNKPKTFERKNVSKISPVIEF